jgi:hypothetical protein
MARNLARNLVWYAQLLKAHPLAPGVLPLQGIHEPAAA